MVWKNIKQENKLKQKILKNGFIGKFSKEKIFEKEKEEFRDFGAVDFADNQLNEKEKRDIKEMMELERRNI